MVTTFPLAEFTGAKNDTVTVRVPAVLDANNRALRETEAITLSTLSESSIDVKLEKDVYSAVRVTDAELTLDISDFGSQILQPQVLAVAGGLEDALGSVIANAPYASTISVAGSGDPFDSIVDARKALNQEKVPISERVVVLGADGESRFLKSEHFNRVDQSGSDTALREAQIGRVAGMDTFVSLALPDNMGVVMHKSAFILATGAPVPPDGATFGSSQAYGGLSLRWLRDYDASALADRSIVNAYIGAQSTNDGDNSKNVRAVKLTFS